MSFIKKYGKTMLLSVVPISVGIGTFALLSFTHHTTTVTTSQQTTNTQNTPAIKQTDTTVAPVDTPTLASYGDIYANGIVPVGDNKYSTTSTQIGQVYLCHAPNGGEGGAGSRGPWFTNNDTQYDINKKAKVSGSINWNGQYSMQLSGSTRTIVTNDVPGTHTTGIFPIQSSDTAYLYDRNPNTIKTQTLTYNLTASPSPLASPGCIGGEVGIMTTGVALFDAFDAGGRDAGAWEVQDSCSGHPQKDGEYHYHTLSSCITDISASKVIGYALDGYPITGPTVAKGNIITTKDLDECHGMTSSIVLDGKTVSSYHYVMTQDFPYSVSCFKAAASQPPHAG